MAVAAFEGGGTLDGVTAVRWLGWDVTAFDGDVNDADVDCDVPGRGFFALNRRSTIGCRSGRMSNVCGGGKTIGAGSAREDEEEDAEAMSLMKLVKPVKPVMLEKLEKCWRSMMMVVAVLFVVDFMLTDSEKNSDRFRQGIFPSRRLFFLLTPFFPFLFPSNPSIEFPSIVQLLLLLTP